MRKLESREFPVGPEVKIQCFHCQAGIPSLSWELRSYKLHGTAKKKKLESRIHFLSWTEISQKRSDLLCFISSVSSYGTNHLEY